MSDFTIYPKNDFAKFVKGKDISATTGAVSDQTTGTVRAFFATSDLPTATPAHTSLDIAACSYVTDKGFLVFFDRAVMDFTILDGLFASAVPYLIIDDGAGWRVAFTGEYVATRPGTVRS